MRSLVVKVNDFRTPPKPDSISEQFAALLAYDLKNGFQLTITTDITFQDEIGVKCLVSLFPGLKSTIQAFRVKNCVVDFASVFQQELMREILVGNP